MPNARYTQLQAQVRKPGVMQCRSLRLYCAFPGNSLYSYLGVPRVIWCMCRADGIPRHATFCCFVVSLDNTVFGRYGQWGITGAIGTIVMYDICIIYDTNIVHDMSPGYKNRHVIQKRDIYKYYCTGIQKRPINNASFLYKYVIGIH